jgi:hypothetical protein
MSARQGSGGSAADRGDHNVTKTAVHIYSHRFLGLPFFSAVQDDHDGEASSGDDCEEADRSDEPVAWKRKSEPTTSPRTLSAT